MARIDRRHLNPFNLFRVEGKPIWLVIFDAGLIAVLVWDLFNHRPLISIKLAFIWAAVWIVGDTLRVFVVGPMWRWFLRRRTRG